MKEEQNSDAKIKIINDRNNLQQLFSNAIQFSNNRKKSDSDEEDHNTQEEKGFLNGNNRSIF